MFERLKKSVCEFLCAACCHHVGYAGLCMSHVFAAMQTGKPEVYVPMAVMYFALSWKG